MKVTIFTDNKKGAGRLKHIQLRQFWVQEAVRLGNFVVQHVTGVTNVADILTKHVSSEDIRVYLHKTGQSIEEGRHEIAP